MERAKTIKKIIFSLICLSVLVLIGFSIYQHRLLKNLAQVDDSETISKVELTEDASPQADVIPQQYASKKTSSPLVQADQGGEYNSEDIEDLEEQLDATEAELDKAYQQIADEAAREEELERQQIEFQKKMFQDPAYKSQIRNSIKNSLDTQYADIFEEMNLSPEKLEEFKDMLADHSIAFFDISPDISSASTEEEKRDVRQRYEKLMEEHEAEIEEFLGDEDYEIYHDYTEMATTRSVINAFKASLSADDQLTKEQEKEITEIMYKEQMEVFSEMGYDPRKTIEFPDDIKEGKIDGQLKNMEKIHMKSLENSRGVLSQSQFEQYENYLKNQREMLEMSMKLSDL